MIVGSRGSALALAQTLAVAPGKPALQFGLLPEYAELRVRLLVDRLAMA